MKKRVCPFLLLSFALVMILMSCSYQDGDFVGINKLDSAKVKDIDRIISAYKPTYNYINIALVSNGEVVLTKSYGQNRLSKTDAYASVSKPVTAMIFMQLL